MKKIVLLLIFTLLLASSSLYAQGQVVQGVVSDVKEAVPGVSVYEKDTPTNGISTDLNGRYQITLRGKSGILVFRSVGYKLAEVQVGTRTSVNVKLESNDQVLNDVVVVGYGEQKKITSTGSVSVVSGKEIRENPSASLQNSLTGRLPGFFSQQGSGRPGADGAEFYIRGVSSYNNNNRPLIIVDDIEYSYDQFARLDPNEIESLSILKDASTTAIYGVRGANGVVVVTTRRGKEGPPQISLRVESSLSQPTKLPTYLNSFQSASLYNQAQLNDNPNATPRFSADDLQKYQDGSSPYTHPDINWKEVLFKKFSQQQRVNLDLTGGTERVKYFVSLAYLFQDGITKNFSKGQDIDGSYHQKRYNYRSNLDIKVTKSLDMRVDLYGNFAQVNLPSTLSPYGRNDIFYDYSSFNTLAPFQYPITNPDGSYGYSRWAQANGQDFDVNNIIGRLATAGYRREYESNMNVVLSAKQKLDFITRGLSFTPRVAYTSNYVYYRSQSRGQIPSFIYDPSRTDDPATSVNEQYIPRDPNIFRVPRLGYDYQPRNTSRVLNVQAVLNYDRTFGDHHVSGLALLNRNSSQANVGSEIYNYIPNNFRGYSARIGYDYKQKYLFQLNAGYNGSSRFVSAERYGLFPAVSAGWNISEEPFFKSTLGFIDLLKLRGSYGIVGNDAIGGFSYYYQQSYNQAIGATNTSANDNNGGLNNGVAATDFGFGTNQIPGITEGNLGNPNVSWEKEKKLDVAVEFAFLNNALTGTVDYFNNNRYDILTNRGTVSQIIGIGLPPVNLGKVNNRGVEVQLNYRKDLTKDITVSVGGNYSLAKNKVIFRDEPTPQYPYQRFTGKSIGQQLVYRWIGFYQDEADIANSPKPTIPVRPGDLKYEDINGDNLITGADRIVEGYPSLPNTNYGITGSFRYKAFSLSVLFQGASNFNVRGADVVIRAFVSNLTEVHTQAWTPELGDNARYPRLSLQGGISDPAQFSSTFWFIRGDYIRLKTAQLNYELPESFTRKLGIGQARIYTNGNNLLTWTKLDRLYDLDPEMSQNGNSVTGSFSNGSTQLFYPPQRLFNLGVSVTF
ncbi:TonB-dependent receptor [Hymenobacter sp.]|jgi:TonB-linked SusC/RagA family outer membrane protein|uniref:SusC/RagA family TonB-linked outer membrane protein n=1 Tax=Hymenobacter sp. TaxID=1898978 RepID=UPI002EDAEB58